MLRRFVIFVCLGACSSGGDGGSASGADAFRTLRSDVIARGITPSDQLPTMGSYSYTGLIRMALPLRDRTAQDYTGDLTVTLAFDSTTAPVHGMVQNLASAGGNTLGGTLDIADGMIMPDADPDTDYQFTASLSGELSDAGTPYMIDGTIAGDVYGGAAQGVAGVVFGDITQPGWLEVFDGRFAGERPR